MSAKKVEKCRTTLNEKLQNSLNDTFQNIMIGYIVCENAFEF